MSAIVDLAGLSDLWRMDELVVNVRGHGALVADAWTLHRFRGAFGNALAAGASKEALAAQVCPFVPPCGYALFHNSVDPDGMGRIDDRPFTIEADDLDGDLLVRVRLFGQATGRASDFLAAMIAACCAGLDDGKGGRVALPVCGAAWRPAGLPPPFPPDAGVVIGTVTPIVQKSEGGSRDRLVMSSLLSGLARRLQGLARWHHVQPGWDMRALSAMCKGACAEGQDLTRLTNFPTGRGTGRLRDAHTGMIRLPPVPPDLAALLRFAEVAHLGADTAFGAGRVWIGLEDPGQHD